ncbi:hypothetical protein FE257_005371 [Aspergillus nanangensis]|uniref:Major facilitator superfamily (MFS) profile domain-containing protein n=1 Tax=Aspergillus nanangensis TaxID=2582783 RepID=A0AAD4GVI0_ASPNN|nr:hypothetical protein FE257_005371 [Aspergillus nanangensis]
MQTSSKKRVLPTTIPFWTQVLDAGAITTQIASSPCPGTGTEEDPFIVTWLLPHDPRNPQNIPTRKKWLITFIAALETFIVTLVSSAYSGAITQIKTQFHVPTETATLGVSLYVLGFALGPLIWAPCSELFGRQVVFIGTYGFLTVFCAASVAAQNMHTLLVLRFLAGAFGSSPFANSGGVIADMFSARERGLALTAFVSAPLLGPIVGPIAGGFLGMEAGWRWVMGLLAILCALLWVLGAVLKPETYAPVLLRRRAETLTSLTGRVHRSQWDVDQGRVSLQAAMKRAFSRPLRMLFIEPIVLLLSVYLAIVYGTLYLLFGAFPIVYQVHRGWNQGVAALPFLGVLGGMMLAILYAVVDHRRYVALSKRLGGYAPPEARLPPCMVASVALTGGLFWFAWTNSPSTHWLVSVAAGVPFGFGMILVFFSVLNYLIDSYTIFAASALAANTVLRSLFGFAFPLFTTYMFEGLGLHWAACVPAFLALACVPFPFWFYKKGVEIRTRSQISAQSEVFVQSMIQNMR